MKKRISLLLCLAFCVCCLGAPAEETTLPYTRLFGDLYAAWQDPADGNLARIDGDAAGMNDPAALAIAECWKEVWLDPDYRVLIHGEDDPAALPVSGKHAFVVLGYQLRDGEMEEELIWRCEAAAAAAKAFPDAILVCTGGATGRNNPEKHTEAGLMKAYLSQTLGIAPDRIFTDERAMNTAENAVRTLNILEEQHVDTMTIVTSSYHLRRAVTLYRAFAAQYAAAHGYAVESIGSFCCLVEKGDGFEQAECRSTLMQLCYLLELPSDQIAQTMLILNGKP